MSTEGAVAASVAAIAAHQRQRLLERFRERGAVSPDTTLTRRELGLEDDALFRSAVRDGTLVEAGDGRYYLDEAAVARRQDALRPVILSLLLCLLILLVILWLVP